MLLNPAGSHRVQANRKEKCKYEIKKSWPTAEINYGYVVECRTRKIDEEPTVPHFDRFQSWGPGHLKERKEHQPDRLAVPFVTHESCLPMVRQVRVVFVIALMRMMLQMVNTKTHCAGHEIGEIGDNGHHLVPAFAPQNQVVSGVMNDHVIRMICERSDAIGNEKTKPPVGEPKSSHFESDSCLHNHDRDGDHRRPRIA